MQSDAQNTVAGKTLRAGVAITLGEALAARSEPGAERYGHEALDALAPLAENSSNPRVLDPYVRALLLLQRGTEVEPYLQRLKHAGYQSPIFELYLKSNHFISQHTRNRTS